MAFLDQKDVSTGELVAGAFAELSENRRAVLIYLGVFLAAELALPPIGRAVPPIGGLLGLGVFAAYFVAQYLLYRSMLERAGYRCADRRFRIFRFFAMAVVIAMGIGVASQFFLIPAVIVAARWVLSPCYIVATDKGVFAALGDSWSATSGNTLSLSLAFTVMVLVFFVLFVLVSVVPAVLEGLFDAKYGAGIGLQILPVLLMGLSVGAFRRLDRAEPSLAEVFA